MYRVWIVYFQTAINRWTNVECWQRIDIAPTLKVQQSSHCCWPNDNATTAILTVGANNGPTHACLSSLIYGYLGKILILYLFNEQLSDFVLQDKFCIHLIRWFCHKRWYIRQREKQPHRILANVGINNIKHKDITFPLFEMNSPLKSCFNHWVSRYRYISLNINIKRELRGICKRK